MSKEKKKKCITVNENIDQIITKLAEDAGVTENAIIAMAVLLLNKTIGG